MTNGEVAQLVEQGTENPCVSGSIPLLTTECFIMSYDHAGRGLRFDGLPTDIEKFNWILAEEGCHPKAAKRIIDRIREKGYDLLTVQSTLNFEWIKMELEKLGITVTFIEPFENWKQKHNDGPWPEEALPERFRRLR